MQKLRMDVAALRVESFPVTQELDVARGTVHARSGGTSQCTPQCVTDVSQCVYTTCFETMNCGPTTIYSIGCTDHCDTPPGYSIGCPEEEPT